MRLSQRRQNFLLAPSLGGLALRTWPPCCEEAQTNSPRGGTWDS